MDGLVGVTSMEDDNAIRLDALQLKFAEKLDFFVKTPLSFFAP
jgi:hypothetical protein